MGAAGRGWLTASCRGSSRRRDALYIQTHAHTGVLAPPPPHRVLSRLIGGGDPARSRGGGAGRRGEAAPLLAAAASLPQTRKGAASAYIRWAAGPAVPRAATPPATVQRRAKEPSGRTLAHTGVFCTYVHTYIRTHLPARLPPPSPAGGPHRPGTAAADAARDSTPARICTSVAPYAVKWTGPRRAKRRGGLHTGPCVHLHTLLWPGLSSGVFSEMPHIRPASQTPG